MFTRKWNDDGVDAIRVRAEDSRDALSAWTNAHDLVIGRLPPTPPEPSGSLSVWVDTLSWYHVRCPARVESLRIVFDWDDGSFDTSRYAAPGESLTLSHAWRTPTSYAVRSRAIDSRGYSSGWSRSLGVSVYEIVGETFWVFKAGGQCFWRGIAVGSDRTVYVSTDDELYAVRFDGTLKWRSGLRPTACPAIGSDGTIYVGSYSDSLVALNPDGSVRWLAAVPGAEWCPAIGDDGTIYVASSEGNRLHAIRADGTQKWQFEASGLIETAPAVGLDGVVYFGTGDPDCCVYALDKEGGLLWRYEASNVIYSHFAISRDGTVYVSSANYLLAIASDGTLKWRNRCRGMPILGRDGTIYVGGRRLIALDPGGNVMWEGQLEGGDQLPPALAADGTIYYTSNYPENVLVAYDSEGNMKWQAHMPNYPYAAMAIGPGNAVYCTAVNRLLAVGGSAPLADTDWPMFQHDAQHTGRVR